MQKRQYLQALACFLAIPAVLIAEGVLFSLIDPELARGHAEYTRNYALTEFVRKGSMIGAAGLALVLWIATCYLVLRARQRSSGWLVLAAGGPVGFAFIAMLEDLAPVADDLYGKFIRKLKAVWRVPFEAVMFVSVWTLAFELMVVKRDVMIRYESFTTGTPVATIVAQQNAESGMRAFGEGTEVMYLVVLIYLLWPLAFNFAGKILRRHAEPALDRVD